MSYNRTIFVAQKLLAAMRPGMDMLADDSSHRSVWDDAEREAKAFLAMLDAAMAWGKEPAEPEAANNPAPAPAVMDDPDSEPQGTVDRADSGSVDESDAPSATSE